MTHCMRHFEDPEVARCRSCDRPFCSRCLVWSFGPNKPPFCVGCALNASGVRNPAKTVVVSSIPPAQLKREQKAQRRAEKAEARALKRAARKQGPEPEVEQVRTTSVPAPVRLSTPASRYGTAADEPIVS
jgi:hypothetical protein